MERCPSGLRCRPGTSVWGRLHRGFESRLLRHLKIIKDFYRDENHKTKFCIGSSDIRAECEDLALKVVRLESDNPQTRLLRGYQDNPASPF